MRLPGSDRRAALDEYRELCRVRLEHVVPVREPLVLVSQVQRSGGTLLSQLFDGHPECHAHPSEIYIGHPRKWEWPQLDLSAPETWFDVLYESPVELHLREGYLETGGRPDSLAVLIVESAPAFAALLMTISRLDGASQSETDAAAAARHIERRVSLPSIASEIVALAGVAEISSAEAERLFPPYLDVVAQLVKYVDNWTHN